MSATHSVIVNSRNMNLDSTTARNSGQLMLERPVYVPEDCDCVAAILDAQIPNNLYNWTGSITIPISYSGAAAENVTFTKTSYTTPAYYTTAQLVTALNGATGTHSGQAATLTLAVTYVDSTTGGSLVGRFTLNISATNAGVLTNFTCASFTNVLLGFSKQALTGGTIATAAYPPYMVPRYYIVASNFVTGGQVPNVGTRPLVLGKIPITTAFGFVENYRAMFPFYHKIKERIISEIDITLLDELGLPVSFNGGDWSMTIIFEFHKRAQKPLNVTV